MARYPKQYEDLLSAARASTLQWGRSDGVLVSRADVVMEARAWKDTPFHHQASVKGVGVDCGGLMRGVSLELGLLPKNYGELLPRDLRAYSRHAVSDFGKQLCDRFWMPINLADVRPADVLLFKWRNGPPQHSAFVGERDGVTTIIHALGPCSPNKVTETALDAVWMPRIVAAYHLPGVEL